MTWFFGQYIERLLDEKGWKRSRLAKEAGLSHVYVNQLIVGDNKGKPPRPTIDTLIALSDALDVDIIDLILAYKGKDPAKVDTKSGMPLDRALLTAFHEFLKEKGLAE